MDKEMYKLNLSFMITLCVLFSLYILSTLRIKRWEFSELIVLNSNYFQYRTLPVRTFLKC